MKKITKEWLKAASDDLETISEIINNEHLTNKVSQLIVGLPAYPRGARM